MKFTNPACRKAALSETDEEWIRAAVSMQNWRDPRAIIAASVFPPLRARPSPSSGMYAMDTTRRLRHRSAASTAWSAVSLTLLILLFAASGARADREGAWRAPRSSVTPPAELRADDLDRVRPPIAGTPVPIDPRDGTTRAVAPREAEQLRALLRRTEVNGYEEVGGDDVVFSDLYFRSRTQIDFASNGDLYLAVGNDTSEPFDEFVEVFRSTDDGESFTSIGRFDSGGQEYELLANLQVVEGVVDRVFVAFLHYDDSAARFEMRVAFADIPSSAPTWQVRTIMDEASVSFLTAHMTHDADFFSDYYLYAVSSGLDGNGDDIWFSRSTDQGDTWSAPFRIASLSTSNNLMYSAPFIAYGPGGELHVAYQYTERLQSTFDDGIVYRKAPNFGATPSDWAGSVGWSLWSIDDGFNDYPADLDVDPASGLVVVSSVRFGATLPQIFVSADGGDSWALPDRHDLPMESMENTLIDDGRIHVAGSVEGDAYERVATASAPTSDPTDWTAPRWLGEFPTFRDGRPSIAKHPSRVPSLAFSYTARTSGSGYAAAFDAEWRDGAGYPNYEAGFPLDVPGGGSGERTPPALSDLDGDGDLEIVFANRDGNVYVVEHDGSVAPGWPIDVGSLGDRRSAVAVGDLTHDGRPEIAVGTADGRVFCFDADGTLREGFPVDLGTDASTYVAIGAVGPPYVRWIVALSGDEQARINYRGLTELKTGTLLGTAIGPPAIGDVDGDGDVEIVYAFDRDAGGAGLHVLNGDLLGGVQAFRGLPSTVSDGLSLGDIDRDGDLEITVPTDSGRLHVLHHDLSDVAGFPYDDPTGSPLTRVAIDQILGTAPPELIFAARDARVTVLYADGSVQPSYPAATTSGWFLFGGPIATSVDTPFGNYVVIGSRDRKAWSFRNVGAIQGPGWPKPLDDAVEVSPAAGDVDADGSNEIVFLGNDRLHVVDVGVSPNVGNEWWRMDGADAARTGCADCVEDVATSVEPDTAVGTRVELRMASGNPASGAATFAFVLDRRARAALRIYDLRGRLVRSLRRADLDAGAHRMVFDGRDDRGSRLAGGTYLARLTLDRDAGSDGAVRKFTWVD